MHRVFNYKPWDDYWYGPIVRAAASGVDVTPDSALGATALWNGVTIIANAIAMVPLRLYRRSSNQGRVEATEDPRFRILHRKPNRWMTSFTWRQMSQGHLLMRGNTFAQKVLNAGGALAELVPLHPTRMEVLVDGDEVVYEYKREDGTRRIFRRAQILHIRGLSTNGVVGYSPVTVLREAMGSMLATDLYASRFFGNGATPPGGVKVKGTLDDKAFKRLKDDWQTGHGGENQHKLAIFENGMEWQSIGFSAEDSQLIASRTFNVQEAARCLNIPPHKLKEMSRATFSNIEEQNIEWVIDTIQPWAENWEQQLNADLLTEREQSTLYFKFDLKALLRGNSQGRAQYFQTRFNMGSISPNEIRELEEEDPIDGGDRYYVQQNLMPTDKIDEILTAKSAPPPPPAQSEPDDDQEPAPAPRLAAFAPVLRDLAARLLHREITAAKRVAKKGDWIQFRVWIDEYYAESIGAIAEQCMPLAASMAQASECVGPDAAAIVRSFLAESSEAFTSESVAALTELLRATGPEDLPDALDALLDSWRWRRPDAFAEREIARGSAMFTRKLLGVA